MMSSGFFGLGANTPHPGKPSVSSSTRLFLPTTEKKSKLMERAWIHGGRQKHCHEEAVVLGNVRIILERVNRLYGVRYRNRGEKRVLGCPSELGLNHGAASAGSKWRHDGDASVIQPKFPKKSSPSNLLRKGESRLRMKFPANVQKKLTFFFLQTRQRDSQFRERKRENCRMGFQRQVAADSKVVCISIRFVACRGYENRIVLN